MKKTIYRPRNNFFSSSLLLLTPLGMGAPFAHAELPKADVLIDSVVVTATRNPQPVADTLAQTTIITRRDIEASGAATLAEILQRDAGVEIRPLGGPGQPTGVFIRGANATHTLVLVDGQRVASSTSGSAAFENLSLDNIERIEVVKGPLSGLYGADAIGGVVQIFTRNSGVPRLTADAGVGSNHARQLSAGFTAVEDKTTLTLNAAVRTIDARSATNPAAGPYTYNPDRDPYQNSSVVLKLSHTLWQKETLSLSVWQTRGKTHYDAGPSDDAVNRQTLTGLQMLSENNFTDWWKSRLSLGETQDDSRIDSSFPGRFKTTQRQYAWQSDFVTGIGTVLAGVERRRESVESSTHYDRSHRDTDSVFMGLTEAVGDQRLSANVRRDREAQFGDRTTGGASYGYRMADDQLVYVSYGTAFRAPSFNDLYYPGFSNPLLRPEKSKSYEYGWRAGKADHHFDLALFETQIDDLIVFDAATFKPQNVKRARVRGWEWSGETVLWGVRAKAGVTAQRPEDRDTGKLLQSRAKEFGHVTLSKNWGSWSATTSVIANGARFDSATESASSRMSGYALWNAGVAYRYDKTTTIDLSAQNLGDKQYEFAKGYNTPGRTVQLGVRFAAF
jgi:vitamin B12 transporter